MSDINQIAVSGRLTRDAVLKNAGGTMVAEITIAANRRIKAKTGIIEEVLYLDTAVWGNLAQTLAPQLKKGVYVFCSGSLKTNKWVDQATNTNRSRIVMSLREIRLGGGLDQGFAAPDMPMQQAPVAGENYPIPGQQLTAEQPPAAPDPAALQVPQQQNLAQPAAGPVSTSQQVASVMGGEIVGQ